MKLGWTILLPPLLLAVIPFSGRDVLPTGGLIEEGAPGFLTFTDPFLLFGLPPASRNFLKNDYLGFEALLKKVGYPGRLGRGISAINRTFIILSILDVLKNSS